MPRHMQRTPLELGLQLNISRLISDGLIQPGKVTRLSHYYWLDDEGGKRASARIEADLTEPSADNVRNGRMRIHAKWINQTIRLVGCPRHFGGQQWYFICPVQNQYVSVLWSLPGRRYFAGRKSLGKQVAYTSQYYSPGARAQYMKDKLCNRIAGPEVDEWDVPPKPKWMRWRTYERASKRLEKYSGEAGVLPILPRKLLLDGEVV
jgi:hypothetical protein